MRRETLSARLRRTAGLGIGLAVLLGLCLESHAQGGARPKVMVVIEERVSGIFGTTGSEEVGQAESTLAQSFMAAGFPVVDPQIVRKNIPRDKALRLLEGDQKAAALAGLQFGAQVVVTGQAISKNAGGKLLGTSMQTLQATVQARAVWSDDARVIGTRTAQASKAHIDELQGGVLAIQEASREVADGLVADMLKGAAPAAAGGARQIMLVVAGLVSYRHLAAVQHYLQNDIKGVKAVTLRQFAQGTAELAVDYAGQSGLIANDLANRKFPGFRLEPINVTPNRLDLQAVLER